MFLPINNVPALAISVIDGGEKEYKDIFTSKLQEINNQKKRQTPAII